MSEKCYDRVVVNNALNEKGSPAAVSDAAAQEMGCKIAEKLVARDHSSHGAHAYTICYCCGRPTWVNSGGPPAKDGSVIVNLVGWRVCTTVGFLEDASTTCGAFATRHPEVFDFVSRVMRFHEFLRFWKPEGT